MENTSQEQTPQPKELKKKGTITGLLVGVIAFLFLLLVTFLLFIFTDIGNTLCSQVGVEECVETEVEDEIKEDNTEVNSLENEGWALYTVPKYDFSVEIPPVSLKSREENNFNRWEVSRMLRSIYDEDVDDQIEINFYPSGMAPDIAACGQGCNGEFQIKINIFNKDTEYNIDSIVEKKKEEFYSIIEKFPGGEDMSLEDALQTTEPFGDDAWCIKMPSIADANFRNCYFEKGNYLFEIVHTVINFDDFGADTVDAELPKILESMKFE